MDFLVNTIEITDVNIQIDNSDCTGCKGTCEGTCDGTCESGCGSGCGSK